MSRSRVNDHSFQLLAGHVALDFANTLDDRFLPSGPRELLPTYGDLLEFCVQTGVMAAPAAQRLERDVPPAEAEHTVQRAARLRSAVYDLIIAHLEGSAPPAAALHTLNEVLSEAQLGPIIDRDGPRFVWRARPSAPSAATPLWLLAWAAAGLLTSSDVDHIRECGASTCRWLFLDRSRNHSRRWCDMKLCGNRRKAARFRQGHGRGVSGNSASIAASAAKNSLRT